MVAPFRKTIHRWQTLLAAPCFWQTPQTLPRITIQQARLGPCGRLPMRLTALILTGLNAR
jgi:hypothetical protein